MEIKQKTGYMQKYRTLRKRRRAFKLSEDIDSPIDLYDHLPFQIAVVSNLLQLNRDLAIREIIDLEPRELRVILNIGSYMPISSADIAYQARLDSYTVSRAVKKLKSLGMIDTQMLDSNKKVKYLILTNQGAEVYHKICEVINTRTTILEAGLSATDKQQLMEILSRLEDKAEAMLADNAKAKLDRGEKIPADQKELIRWRKKSVS